MVARFDELESEVRRRRDAAAYLPNLQEMFVQAQQRGAPPPPQPWMRRPGSLRPIGNPPLRANDPAPVDTFDQRFNPGAYPPVAPPRGEKSFEIPPGTQERFADPTKVIADASGAIPATGKKSDEQPYPAPQGFKFDEALPQGFKFDVPEDPAERAALRTQQSVRPRGGRQEGAATAVIESAIPATAKGMMQTVEAAKQEGTSAAMGGDYNPKPVLESAFMANPAALPLKAGTVPASIAAQRVTGVMSIPRAADAGPLGQAISTRFGKTPEMAQRASAELQAAGEGAATRAAGGEVDQVAAGTAVRNAITEAGDKAHPRLTLLNDSRRGPEDVIDHMYSLARTGSKDDLAALGQLTRLVPVEQRGVVQGALIQRLGQGTEGFSPEAFVGAYSSISNNMKNVLFGRDSLRYHLDSIEAVSRRASTWQHLEQGKSPLMAIGAAAGAMMVPAGPIAGPLTVLGAVIPLQLMGRYLAKPASAASIAQWSRAYERVMRTKGAPNAMATFGIATRNLNNSLGTDVDPATVLKGTQNEQPVE